MNLYQRNNNTFVFPFNQKYINSEMMYFSDHVWVKRDKRHNLYECLKSRGTYLLKEQRSFVDIITQNVIIVFDQSVFNIYHKEDVGKYLNFVGFNSKYSALNIPKSILSYGNEENICINLLAGLSI